MTVRELIITLLQYDMDKQVYYNNRDWLYKVDCVDDVYPDSEFGIYGKVLVIS